MGRFVEFYGPQRLLAGRVLGLSRVEIARAGFGFGVGFLLHLAAEYVSRAARAGYAVVEVREVGCFAPSCAERRVMSVWIPTAAAVPSDGGPLLPAL